MSAQTGLLVECLYLAVPAVAYTGWRAANGHGSFGRSAAPTLLLIVCGPATVVPLALFAFAARRLPLIDFLQFISPTPQFCCGLAAGETLAPLTTLSFLSIWAGVAVFAAERVRSRWPRFGRPTRSAS